MIVKLKILFQYFENGSMPFVGSEKAGLNARQILDTFRADGLPIIHIQHIAARPAATFFVPQTKGSKIHDKVKPTSDEKVIITHYQD